MGKREGMGMVMSIGRLGVWGKREKKGRIVTGLFDVDGALEFRSAVLEAHVMLRIFAIVAVRWCRSIAVTL